MIEESFVPDDFTLLRLGSEPRLNFTEAQVHAVLTEFPCEFMGRLEALYKLWAKKPEVVNQPEKIIFSSSGIKGDWRVMPCVIDRFDGSLIKVVKVIGTNEEQRTIQDKICVGQALLIDNYDNHVKASFDVCALSSFRTAAISALAYKHTTASEQDQVAIIGAGRIGFYTAFILKAWLGVEDFVFHDKVPERAELLAKRFEGEALLLQDALKRRDSVFVCTDSTRPLLNRENSGETPFISSVGADADNLSELESDLIQGRRLVSESRQNVKFGDMARWCSKKAMAPSDVVDLTSIIGEDVKSPDKLLFISTGAAVQDALICDFILSHYTEDP